MAPQRQQSSREAQEATWLRGTHEGSLSTAGFHGTPSRSTTATISLLHNHVATCGFSLVPRFRQHEICAAMQATNAAAWAELYYSIVWHHWHLACGATSTLISSLHEHVVALKILESLKNWSSHGLSNRTGSAGPYKNI